MDKSFGVKVVAVCPGPFKTPLWTPEKMAWTHEEPSWTSIEEVLDGYIKCIEDDSIQGGSCYEILSGFSRLVPKGGLGPEGLSSLKL